MKKVRIVVDIPISEEALEEFNKTAEEVAFGNYTVQGDAMEDGVTIAREFLDSDEEFIFDGDDSKIVSVTLIEGEEE